LSLIFVVDLFALILLASVQVTFYEVVKDMPHLTLSVDYVIIFLTPIPPPPAPG